MKTFNIIPMFITRNIIIKVMPKYIPFSDYAISSNEKSPNDA
jgi:hypothetical protein